MLRKKLYGCQPYGNNRAIRSTHVYHDGWATHLSLDQGLPRSSEIIGKLEKPPGLFENIGNPLGKIEKPKEFMQKR